MNSSIKFLQTIFKVVLVSFFALTSKEINAQCNVNQKYDKIVSGYHSSIALSDNGNYLAWGQAIANDGATDQAGPPKSITVSNYPTLTGTVLLTTMGGPGSGGKDQYIALSTTGLFAWGAVGSSTQGVLSSTLKSTAAFGMITTPTGGDATTKLPIGVTPSQVTVMIAMNQTLALVANGNVWILSFSDANMQGDGTASAATTWHKVKISAGVDLTNVTEIRGQVAASGTQSAMMALTSNGTAYTWGSSTYLGNGTAPAARNYATQMTLPVEFTSSNIPKMIGVTGGTNGTEIANTYYVLSNSGALYSMGDNASKQCGDFTSTERRSWVNVKLNASTNFSNINFISAQEHTGKMAGAAAITKTGVLYSWGDNNGNMLGRTSDGTPTGAVGTTYDPGTPVGFTVGSDKAIFTELGGHTLVYVKEGSSTFCYVGHRTNGSMGESTSSSGTVVSFDCTNTPTISLCGAVPVAADPTKSVITANPTTIVADGVSTSAISIQLKNSAGANLTTTGGSVDITTTAGTVGTVIDNNNGTYSATLTSSNTVTTATLSFAVNGTTATGANSTATVAFISSSITTTASLSSFSTCLNSASTAQSFTVSASGLSANLIITPPIGYEVSSLQGGGYASSLTITPTAGSVSSTSVWVRLTGASAGSFNGNISCTSTGTNTQTIAITGSVSAASVGGSIAGATSVCTGTNSTTLTLSGHTGSVTKWQSSTDGTNWSDIANTTTTLTATNLTVTTQYRAVVTSGVCSAANSSTATVTVNALPTFSGNALNFDGNDDYVQSTYSTALNITTNLTMELWIYPTKNSGTQNVISKSSSGQNNVSYIFPRTDDGWNTFSAYFTFNGTGWTIVNTPYTSLNSWHHVAMTYDGSNVRIYMDGTLVKTQAASGSITTNTNPLYIGNQHGYPEFFGGSVDEVRIWNVVRSQSQIQANMNNELSGSETGLVAYYKFNEGTPGGNNSAITTTADSSPNSLNGTLNAFAKTGSTSNFIASSVGSGSISGNSSVCTGSTITLSNSTSGGTWTSSDVTVATVGANTGVVTGVGVGTATITYTITNGNGCTNSATKSITVNVAPSGSAITGTTTVCAGSTTTLSNATSGGVWSSSNTAIATVGSATGIVTGVAAGTVTITYTATNGSGCSVASTTSFTVNASTTLSANTGTASACIGSTSTLSNSTAGGTWSTSNSSVATVGSSTGVFTGVAAGTAIITYTYTNGNSCTSTASTTVTITALPVVPAISGSTSVCVGSTITLTNSTAGGVWSSSNNAIATVSTSGVVTGNASGSVTITYTVTGANGCAPVAVTTTITVNPVPSLTSSLGGVNIVTTNLKVNLDAANSASYAGSGSTWYDLSGNNLNGAISGATYSSTAGGLFSFNGTSDFVRIGTVPNTGNPNKSVSFGVWVSPNTSNGNIVSMSNTNPQGSWNMPPIAAYTGKFDGKIWNGNHLLSSNYTNNNWYYVVIVFDYAAQTQTLYVNGQAVDSQSGTGYAASGVNNYFFLGQANPGADNRGMFNGRISVLHIYGDKALTLQEVQQNYNATAPRYGLPIVSSAPSGLATCSGSTFTYTPTSSVTGTSFSWSRAAVTGISNPAATGTGDVNEVLVNTTTSPITVNYTYTLTANGCSSSQNVSVTVNPLPVLSANTGNSTVCIGGTTTFANSTIGGTWSSSNTAIAQIDASTGVVTGVTSGTAIITYTYVANGGCTSSVTSSVTVSPVSVGGTASSSQIVCAGTQPNDITLTGYVGAIQWQVSTDNQNWTNINGATSAILTSAQLGSINVSSYVRAVVTNSVCSSSNSNTVTITLDGIAPAGTISSPFTSLGMARTVSTAGIYYFNLTGTTFSSYVDANGWVKVILDYGQTSGDLTQVTDIDNVSRAILSPAVLSKLTDANEIRISSNSGTLDVTNNNPALLSRVVNNQSISRGVSDNSINVGWTGLNTVGATFSNSGCDNGFSFELHKMIFHACGDGASGFHWLPTQGYQTLSWGVGGISGSTTIELWVRAPGSSSGGGGSLSINGANSVCEGASITLTNNANGGTWLTSNSSIATISSSGVVTGVSAGTVTITYNKTSALGCLFTATKSIIVNALPTVNTISNIVVGGGASVSTINFTGSVGTSFTWTNSNTAIGLPASGSGDITSFTAVNAGATPIIATIDVTPTNTSSCVGTSTSFTITVNPAAQVNPVPTQVVTNGQSTTAINFTTNNTGGTTTYQWSNNNTSVGLPASGTGSIPAFVGINNGTSPQYAQITVTPYYTSGGVTTAGTPIIVLITVNPNPQINPIPSQVLNNGENTNAINYTTVNTGGVTTYAWTNNTTSIGLAAAGSGDIASFTAINNGTAPVVAILTATPTFTNALLSTTGSPVMFTITVNPTAQINAVSNQVISSGQNTTAVNFATNNTGGTTTYTWTNSNSSIGLAASGTGSIPSFVGVNTGTSPIVATITVTPTFANAGASNTGAPITFTITINPAAQVNAVANQVLSNGQNTAAVNFTTVNTGGTTTYAWTNNTTSIGLAASGSGNIAAFTALNTGTAPVVATIIVTPSYTNAGVTTAGTPVTFTITVNPAAQVNQPASQVISNGQSTAVVTFTTVNTGGTTTYDWVNNTTSIGLAASGTGNIAAFIGVNTGTSPVVATITVTPTYTNAGITIAGPAKTFTITVNPTPQVNQPANQVVSNGQSTAAVNFATVNTGGTTTYAWVNNTTSIGLAASGTGNIAAFTAINTGTAPVVATITVIPTYTNAGLSTAGTPVVFTITVNPSGQVNQPANQVLNHGQNTTSVSFSTVNTGGTTTYAWVNNTTSIGLVASGTGDIASFTAINTGTAPVVATITVTPTFTNGGLSFVGVPKTYTITVNPIPTVNAIANQVVCNNSQLASVAFSGAVSGTVYNWTNNTTGIGLAASGTGNLPVFTAINNGTSPIIATITVTPTFTNGGVTATGLPKTFTITINPTAVVSAGSLPSRICISDSLVQLNGTPVGGYWTGIGADGFNFIPNHTALGSFTLTYNYVNAYACSSSASIVAKVEPCLERDRRLADDAAIIYPIPSDGHITLKINSHLYDKIELRLYKANGQYLGVKTFSGLSYGKTFSLDLSYLPNGVYFAKLTNDIGINGGYKVIRFIVQH